ANNNYNNFKNLSNINYNISTASSNPTTTTKTLTACNKTFNTNTSSHNSNSNSNSDIFGTRNMSYSLNSSVSSYDDQAQLYASADDQLIGSLFAADLYSPNFQLQMESEPRAPLAAQPLRPSRTSRSLPDLHPTADMCGAPLLLDMFSIEAFAEALGSSSSSVPATPAHHHHQQQQQLFSGPATAPIRTAMYSEPPMMPSMDTQYSAYDSFLNTPMNPEYFTSPNVSITGSQQHSLSSEQMLFAPLDEFGAKDAASPWTEDDLLAQLINSDPDIRHSFVHALVNHISPTVAYQPIGASPSPLSFVTPQQQSSQNLSAAAQMSDVVASEAPVMDSFLGLLSPMADFVATPMMMAGAATASPAMLELIAAAPAVLLPVFKTPRIPSNAADDEDDVPLLKRKWSSDEDDDMSDDDEGSPQQQQQHQQETGKKYRFYCEICNRGFSRQFNMATHKLTHDPKSEAARPFACAHCPRTFTRKHDLGRHQVTHDDSGAIKCTVCFRGFARQD
ncbi:hypothetical protein GGI00_005438, partial [Coemansia sp. RSA 2681]